jgi:hypothetical protein
VADKGYKDGGLERLEKQGTTQAMSSDHNPNGLGGETCNLNPGAPSYKSRAKTPEGHPSGVPGARKKK